MTSLTVVIQNIDGSVDFTTMEDTQISELINQGFDVKIALVKVVVTNPNGTKVTSNFLDSFNFNIILDNLIEGQTLEIIDTITIPFPLPNEPTPGPITPPPGGRVPGGPSSQTPPQTPPPTPGDESFIGDEFSQSFTVIEYKTTSKGLSLFIQMQVSKNKEIGPTAIVSALEIFNSAHQKILHKEQEINIAGVNKFGIVYDIEDLRQETRDQGGGESTATAIIFIEHTLLTLTHIALSNQIEIRAVVEQPTTPPSTTKGDPLFSKLVGIFATLTAASFMIGKVRKWQWQ